MSERYKLLSPKKTLLGTVTFPDHFEDRLLAECRRYGYSAVRFHAVTPQERERLFVYDPNELPSMLRVGTIVMRHDYSYGEKVVELHDISLKDFEALPGCTLTLSMAYVETLLRKE